MLKKSLLILGLLSFIVSADTIHFKNGALLEGKVEAQTAQTVTINVDGKSTTYSMHDVNKVDTLKVAPPPPPIAPAPVPASSTKVISSGSILHIITTSEINTKQHSSGHQFSAKLESNLMSNGVVIAPAGATVYGTVLESKQARRLIGKSKLVISMTAISIDGNRVLISTNKLNVMNETGQGRNTAKKVARGAAIGALVDGSSGAGVGAKVGIGAAILTRGEATGIKAGTLLNFTIVTDIKL